VDGEELNRVFARFKAIADYKKEVTDQDLVQIVSDGVAHDVARAYS